MTVLSKLSILVLALALILPVANAADPDELVIYSGRSDRFVKPVIDTFTRQTGIKVILFSAESTELLNKLRVEGQRTKADLFLSNDAGNLQLGSEQDLFQPVSEKIVEIIPENLRAKDNSWIGLSARARVLVANKNNSNDFIKSVFDLADPRLKDRLAITNSSNESYIAGTTVYMLAAGKEKTKNWLEGMKANVGSEVFDKHSKIVAAVASGKKDVGLVNHYYIYRYLAENPDAPIRVILPDQGEGGMGVAWNVAGVAISKYSRKKKHAEQLVEFLVSQEGQQMFAEVNREYPARTGVKAAPEVPPAGSYNVADVPMYQLGKQRNATIDLIEAVGMP